MENFDLDGLFEEVADLQVEFLIEHFRNQLDKDSDDGSDDDSDTQSGDEDSDAHSGDDDSHGRNHGEFETED